MITQTLALLLDAYRELNARKMFWVSLVLSGLVVIAFAFLTVNEKGIFLFGISIWSSTTSAEISQGELLLGAFLTLGVQFLTFIAVILAILSTASIFPDFISGGSIDLFLSKPIGRLRLFLTKYVSGLLFVALQITAFCACSFLLIGIRGKLWLPGIFVAVPLIVCFFSYLYCVSVLVGVLTRSTLAAILLTFLFWLLIFGLHATDAGVLAVRTQQKHENRYRAFEVQRLEGQIAFLSANPTEPDAAKKIAEKTQQRDKLRAEMKGDGTTLERVSRVVYLIKTPLPKTSETVALIDRWLGDAVKTERMRTLDEEPQQSRKARDEAVGRELDQIFRSRSPRWIVGTSLVFEAVVVALAAWVFCRRDY